MKLKSTKNECGKIVRQTTDGAFKSVAKSVAGKTLHMEIKKTSDDDKIVHDFVSHFYTKHGKVMTKLAYE